MPSDQEILTYCQEFLSLDADLKSKTAIEYAKKFSNGEYIHISARIIYIATREYGLDAAEEIILPLLSYDETRTIARWEMGFQFGIAGQPTRAIPYLRQAVEADSRPDWMLWLAVQYAILKESNAASEILQRIEREHPQSVVDVAVHRQFFNLLGRFDREAAYNLLQEVRSRFTEKPVVDLETDIRMALDEGRPYLLLRLGDGEGACIRLSQDDELAHREYYRSNRNEFADIWFKDTSVFDDPAFIDVVDSFNLAIGHADAIGGSMYEAAVVTEYDLGSRRGIAWVVNVMRKLLQFADRDPEWARRVSIYSLVIHYDLLLTGSLARLLRDRPFVGLISCQENLPAALKHTYRIGRVEFLKTPGEQIHAGTLGQSAVAGRHWPNRFLEICAMLNAPADRRGELWLVAAGMLGKIYAAKLKARGAVVLDIGAVADLWMGKVTRSFPTLPDHAKLTPIPGTITVVDVGGLDGLSTEWLPHLHRIRPILFDTNPAEAAMARTKIADAWDGMVVECALSNRAERRTLHVTKSLGCASLLNPDRDILAPYTIAPAFQVTHEIEVECVRFDSLVASDQVPQPDVIKIDMQGFEYQVLEGFGEILRHCIGARIKSHLLPVYRSQYTLNDIVSIMNESGLSLRRIEPIEHFDGDLVEVNAIFTCSVERIGELSSEQAEKLAFVERVWNLQSRCRSFGPHQFD